MVKSGIKVKLKSNTGSTKQTVVNQVSMLIKEVEITLKRSYLNEIKKMLLSAEVQNYFIRNTLGVIFEMQSEYYGGGIVAQEDPTSLVHAEYIKAIETEIRNNFAIAASSLSADSDLNLVLLSDDFIGFGREGDTTGTSPIQWLSFFLSGSLGNDLYWINKDTYEILKGSAPSGQLGRFGVGHLWQITSPSEKDSINARLKGSGYSFSIEQLRHPQSGKAGKNWFADILTESEIQLKVIQPAIQNAVQYVQAKYASSK